MPTLPWSLERAETWAGPKPNEARSPSSALLPTFFGEGSPTKIDYRKKGTLIPTSSLEDLRGVANKLTTQS